ncbi:uncharacterized protein [Clinocottus analis]|uniref:uncharacterized protein n=1 Tax=Clinocottus analis TaxID=304258 RepID=UPI0035BF6A6F
MSSLSLEELPMESWMSHLPCALWDTPLYHLAIPGSHNAVTYCLDMDDGSPVDLTQPDLLQKLDRFMKPLIRPFVYKWAVTQDYNIKQQLDSGVRYCDLRIAHRPNDNSTDLYFYHGVYTTLTVETVLLEIREWLDARPREVLILSFSHFLGLSQELHSLLLSTIRSVFSSRLCPKTEPLTLRNLWSLGHSVIVSYEHNLSSCHAELWPHIPYWWANKCRADALIQEFEDRKQHGRPGGFFVTGINLTEDLKYICTHPTESLKDLVTSTYPALLGWVREQTPGCRPGSLNIIAGDFVSESRFVPTVVALNEKLLKRSLDFVAPPPLTSQTLLSVSHVVWIDHLNFRKRIDHVTITRSPDLDLLKPGVVPVQLWFRPGLSPVRSRFSSGPVPVQLRSGPGSALVRSRFSSGPVPVVMDWMSRLPEPLWDVPLPQLAIPGSHDTMSYSLDVSSPLLPSESDAFRLLDAVCCCVTRPIIFRWATTQDKSIEDQLSLGIRFFDLRVAHKPNDSSSELRFTHVIYTHLIVLETLASVSSWLAAHPKEVVILACSHFEGLDEELHRSFILSLRKLFGSRLCPRKDSLPTLRGLWARGQQVVLSYDCESAEREAELWPAVPYWWANQRTASGVIGYLDRNKERGRPDGFFVSGLNLTADRFYIAENPKESLRTLTFRNWEALRSWVEEQQPGADPKSLNIIAGDFVGPLPLCPLVIALNQKLLHRK